MVSSSSITTYHGAPPLRGANASWSEPHAAERRTVAACTGGVRERPTCYNLAWRKEAAMATATAYTLDQFLADTRATIKTKGIPAGLAEVRDHLEKLLHNPELLKKHLGDPT